MKIKGHFFLPRSSKSHRATLEARGSSIVVHGNEFERIDDLVIQSIQEPESIYFKSGYYFKSDDPLPQEIYPIAQGKVRLAINWLEDFNFRKALLLLATLAVFVVAFRVIYHSATDLIVFFYPEKWEEELGQSVYEIFQFAFSESNLSPQVQDDIRLDAEKIAAANMNRRVEIVFHSSEFLGPNAIAFPGGPVLITDELVRILDNREQTLAIIAHELAHVRLRHGLEKIVELFGMTLIPALLLNSIGGEKDAITSSLVLLITDINSLRHSRELEKEADLLAADFLENSGIDPNHLLEAMKNLFEYLCGSLVSYSESACMEEASWFSTHPSGSERLEYLTERIHNE